MSKRSKNLLLTLSGRGAHSTSAKDELLAMKYRMDRPLAPVYPYNDSSKNNGGPSNSFTATYPDYKPWIDHTEMDTAQAELENAKITNLAYLNKGYFEPPLVLNEYISARSMVQGTLFSSAESRNSALAAVSQLLAAAYNTRIKTHRIKSSTFRLPSRVTLTALKRDLWFKDLTRRDIPLELLAGKIPHGVKNKQLVDALVLREVPLERALWFTKVVLSTEGNKRRKEELLVDWTKQLADYLYKFPREAASVNSHDKKALFSRRLNYLLEYIKALYVECLLDREVFLEKVVTSLGEDESWAAHPTSNTMVSLNSPAVPLPYKSPGINTPAFQMSALPASSASPMQNGANGLNSFHMQLATSSYQQPVASSSSTGFEPPLRLVMLLLVQTYWNDILKSKRLCSLLAESLLIVYRKNSPISKTVCDMVNFLFRFNFNLFIFKTWPKIGEVLLTILSDNSTETEKEEILKQYKIVRYRNESLVLVSDGGFRASDDLLGCIECIDRGIWCDIKISTVTIPLLLHHCVTNFRTSPPILSICLFIKNRRPILISTPEYLNTILEVIYDLAEKHLSDATFISAKNLYILVNELFQLKLFTISAYLRKLIALGLLYGNDSTLDDSDIVLPHIQLLQNLPILNNRQCDNILKKHGKSVKFQTLFDQGCEVVKTELIKKSLEGGTPDLTFVYNLPIGLQFLVVNYATNEFKTVFSQLLCLIHIFPETIAQWYEFYSKCGSLTAFFNGIVKVILKDKGVVIYYIDVLRLIGRLIIKHKRLVEMLVSCTPPGTPLLFQLVIKSYNDLMARDYVPFNFASIWNFMKAVNFEDPDLQAVTLSFAKLSEHDRNDILKELALEEPVQLDQLLGLLEKNPDIQVVKLLSEFKSQTTFATSVRSYLSRSSDSNTLLQRLVIYDVLDISIAVDIEPDLLENISGLLAYSEQISFEVEIDTYLEATPVKMFTLLRNDRNRLDLLQNLIVFKFGETLAEFTSDRWEYQDMFSMLIKVLGIEDVNVDEVSVWRKVPVDEFLLPAVQLLMAIILRHCPKFDINNILEPLLLGLKLNFAPDNTFFGELFRFIDLEHQILVLGRMEQYFLNQGNEYLKSLDDNRQAVPLIEIDAGNGHMEMVKSVDLKFGYYKDFFTKFPVSNEIGTSPELLRELTSFAIKISQVIEDSSVDMYKVLLIFFRILILHKQALTVEPALLQALVQVLNLQRLVNNNKLHILLYDLLTLQKGKPGTEMVVLPELKFTNTLSKYVVPVSFPQSLDEEELYAAGDYFVVNGGSLQLEGEGRGLLKLQFKSYEILEEFSGDLNGSFINLLLFEAYTTKQNPP